MLPKKQLHGEEKMEILKKILELISQFLEQRKEAKLEKEEIKRVQVEQQQKTKELPLEYQIDLYGNSNIIFSDHSEVNNLVFLNRFCFIRPTPGRILFYDIITSLLSNSCVQPVSPKLV